MQETQEMWVWSLNWEDPLEKDMATHSIVLPGESYGQISLEGYGTQGQRDTTGHSQERIKTSREMEKWDGAPKQRIPR